MLSKHCFFNFLDVIAVNKDECTTRMTRKLSMCSQSSLNALCHSKTSIAHEKDCTKLEANVSVFRDWIFSTLPFLKLSLILAEWRKL